MTALTYAREAELIAELGEVEGYALCDFLGRLLDHRDDRARMITHLLIGMEDSDEVLAALVDLWLDTTEGDDLDKLAKAIGTSLAARP